MNECVWKKVWLSDPFISFDTEDSLSTCFLYQTVLVDGTAPAMAQQGDLIESEYRRPSKSVCRAVSSCVRAKKRRVGGV
jgi:hypothetical protein